MQSCFWWKNRGPARRGRPQGPRLGPVGAWATRVWLTGQRYWVDKELSNPRCSVFTHTLVGTPAGCAEPRLAAAGETAVGGRCRESSDGRERHRLGSGTHLTF